MIDVDHPQLGKKILKCGQCNSFDKNISDLKGSRDGQQPHETALRLFSHNMTVDVKMFRPFMEDGICRNVKSTLVVIVKDWRARTSYT